MCVLSSPLRAVSLCCEAVRARAATRILIDWPLHCPASSRLSCYCFHWFFVFFCGCMYVLFFLFFVFVLEIPRVRSGFSVPLLPTRTGRGNTHIFRRNRW